MKKPQIVALIAAFLFAFATMTSSFNTKKNAGFWEQGSSVTLEPNRSAQKSHINHFDASYRSSSLVSLLTEREKLRLEAQDIQHSDHFIPSESEGLVSGGSFDDHVLCPGFHIPQEQIQMAMMLKEQEESLQALKIPVGSIFDERPDTENLQSWMQVPAFMKIRLLPVSIANDDGSEPSPVYIHEEYLKAYLRQLFIDIEILPTVQLNSTKARVPDHIYILPSMLYEKGRIDDPVFDDFVASIPKNQNIITAFFIGGTVEYGTAPMSFGFAASTRIAIRNTYDYWMVSSLLISHEIGHCGGLKHVGTAESLIPDDQSEDNVMNYGRSIGDWRFEQQRFDGFAESQLERVWKSFVTTKGFTPYSQTDPFLAIEMREGYKDMLMIFPTIQGSEVTVQSSTDLQSWNNDIIFDSEWGAPILHRWTETRHQKYFRLQSN